MKLWLIYYSVSYKYFSNFLAAILCASRSLFWCMAFAMCIMALLNPTLYLCFGWQQTHTLTRMTYDQVQINVFFSFSLSLCLCCSSCYRIGFVFISQVEKFWPIRNENVSLYKCIHNLRLIRSIFGGERGKESEKILTICMCMTRVEVMPKIITSLLIPCLISSQYICMFRALCICCIFNNLKGKRSFFPVYRFHTLAMVFSRSEK